MVQEIGVSELRGLWYQLQIEAVCRKMPPVPSSPAMAEGAAVLGCTVQDPVTWGGLAGAQEQEPGSSINDSRVPDRRVRIGYHRLDDDLFPSKMPEDYGQAAALRIAAQLVIQPKPSETHDLFWTSFPKVAMEIGRANAYDGNSQELSFDEHTEIEE